MSSRDNLRDFYNRRYWNPARSGRTDSTRHERFLQAVDATPPGVLLDVGSGDGLLLRCARRRGLQAVGLDFSRTALDLSRSFGEPVVVEADCVAMPFQPCAFDYVVNAGGLEHVPDTEAALREMVRVLRPGGRLCAIVPNSTFWLSRLGFYRGTGQLYERARTLGDWSGLFERAGLTVDAVTADPGPRLDLLKGGVRSLAREAVLGIARLLPLEFTYQFVFACTRLTGPAA